MRRISCIYIIAHILVARAEKKKTTYPIVRFSDFLRFANLLQIHANKKMPDYYFAVSDTNLYDAIRDYPDYIVAKHDSIRIAKRSSLEIIRTKLCSHYSGGLHDFIQNEANAFFEN